ncbi:adenylyl-sulfate kinase [Pseudokineococcus sp. 1T1Z-3]|uniref:adenylyl-sulfate kinase n=1 Tax=Pseudokineococcus sp. 1T1Z-3 TaxID=3132745 RepID=UPI0030AC49CA
MARTTAPAGDETRRAAAPQTLPVLLAPAALADLRLVSAGLLPDDVVLGGDAQCSATGGTGVLVGTGATPEDRPEVLTLVDVEGTPVGALEDLRADDRRGEVLRGQLRVTSPPLGAAPTASGRRLVVLRRPPTAGLLAALRTVEGPPLVLLPSGSATPDDLPAHLLRALAEDAGVRPEDLVPLPLAWRDARSDVRLLRHVTSALGARDVVVLPAAADDPGSWRDSTLGWTVPAAETHEQWVSAVADLRAGHVQAAAGTTPSALALLRRRWPARSERGLVVLLTGLSGSGKSTLARGLRDRLVAAGERTVSLLDGDVVRRLLSSGLGFDAEARHLNVQRIGYVAAEVARHGGVAVCAPIAPYARSRAAVRAMVEEVGDLLLVHVSTPLEVCEARDVKGLYARARSGELPAFTGVSDPYEVPTDADLVLDTSQVPLTEALDALVEHLERGGWVTPSR